MYAPDGWSWLLYFNHWIALLATFYFTLAAALSFVAVHTSGGATSGPPMAVVFCNLAYGGLVPGSIVSALASGLVFYHWSDLFDDANKGITDCATTFGLCGMALLDLIINRQPYYASFHALAGCLLCWGYAIFTITCYFTDITDAVGHRYIYPELAWAVPLRGGGSVTGSKLLAMNIFLVTPLLNYGYWFLIWARRRVFLSTKSDGLAV